MSLNFDLTACKTRLGEARYNSITTSPWDSKKWHPVTDCLIWNCMFTGLGEITEKNVDEFVARLSILRMKHGPELRFGAGDEGIALTRKDVENHIGLRTNCFPAKTRAKWLAEVFADANLPKSDDSSAHEKINALYDAQQAEEKPDHALHEDDGELPEYDKID